MNNNYIQGKFTKVIYSGDTGYVVALFRVSEVINPNISHLKNKSITVTGILPDLKESIPYKLYGEYTLHEKYSWQYAFNYFEVVKPTTKESIIEFLASPFVEGCGKTTAENIVNKFGTKSLDKIKESYENLLKVKGITEVKALKIYNSVIKFEKNDGVILKLSNLGFTMEESARIFNKHMYEVDSIIEGNFYILKDLFDFDRIDNLYTASFDSNSPLRCKECILQACITRSFEEGSTYYSREEIYDAVSFLYKLNMDGETFDTYLEELLDDKYLIKIDSSYYLKEYYDEEVAVSHYLRKISEGRINKITDTEEKLKKVQIENGFVYNDEQIKAITDALCNNITIISGGPGTGKTTIVKAIVKMYIDEHHLTFAEVTSNIALLAPTGRASKKLSMATGLPAYTIHRFLKWHKDSDEFEYNEYNKVFQKFIIVDESSMIDISLMKSLLCALNSNVQLVLVGDIYQLPSVGPGLVLQDLINSDLFTFDMLNTIYRQSDNSYIPFLAKDIKLQNIDEEFMYKRDDYNFIPCEDEEIMPKILATVKYALDKGINEDNLQVLAPMYKGVNGIDNLNNKLQAIYNPLKGNMSEIKYGDKTYRENDKVLQLVNDADLGVFNGDIGRIIAIYKSNDKKMMIQIDFDGNIIEYSKKDLKNITHAYAITIHKSQGSEFEHVIMPICKGYFRMLYNKLLYTGVSRAKKSLTIIGDPRSFTTGISNNYSSTRKTSLQEMLKEEFKEK